MGCDVTNISSDTLLHTFMNVLMKLQFSYRAGIKNDWLRKARTAYQLNHTIDSVSHGTHPGGHRGKEVHFIITY